MPRSKINAITLTLALAAAATAYAAPSTQPAAKPYPLKTCMVSGEELGEMGEPKVIVYKGQEVKFCCGACVKKFQKDPDTYMKKLADAEKHPTTKPAA